MYKAHPEPPWTETDLFLLTVPDDTEEAPWMVMGDPQFWTATTFASALRVYAQSHHLDWYVAGMLPIRYPRPSGRNGQVAPDVLVAQVPQRERHSYDLAEEGVFPGFVLEILSPASIEHDQTDKRLLYDVLGAREYLLFAPEPDLHTPPLQGYRRHAQGRFERWAPDAQGRLWSDELGLFLVAEGRTLRAIQQDGRPLLTHEESEAERLREEAARRSAEEELARLRALLEHDPRDG